MRERVDSYDPDMIAVIDGALTDAWQRVLRESPGLAATIAEVDATRRVLAMALLEAVDAGMRDRNEMASYALNSLPVFRSRGSGFRRLVHLMGPR